MNNFKEYVPTTSERKVLDALADPENYLVSVTELCKKAEVGRNTYYSMLKKEGFLKARNKVLDKVFESLVPDVKKAAVKFALNNAKNFQDRKMILEIAGEYKPSQSINVSTEELTEEELDKRIKELQQGE